MKDLLFALVMITIILAVERVKAEDMPKPTDVVSEDGELIYGDPTINGPRFRVRG